MADQSDLATLTPQELVDELVRRTAGGPDGASLRTQRRARALAAILKDAPYSTIRAYIPGLFLPATNIIGVDGIPFALHGGAPGEAVGLELKTPGVVVGLHGQLAGEAVNNGWVDFQMSYEAEKALAINAQTGSLIRSFAPMSVFSETYPWFPTMIPARGAGGWALQFRNRNAATDFQPVFALAFLKGRAFYLAAGGEDDPDLDGG